MDGLEGGGIAEESESELSEEKNGRGRNESVPVS